MARKSNKTEHVLNLLSGHDAKTETPEETEASSADASPSTVSWKASPVGGGAASPSGGGACSSGGGGAVSSGSSSPGSFCPQNLLVFGQLLAVSLHLLDQVSPSTG